jgi:hypothetical protein
VYSHAAPEAKVTDAEEQGAQPAQDVNIGVTTVLIREDGGAKQIKKIEMQENPNWSKLRRSVQASNVFKAGGSKRAKRLSRVMKARRNSVKITAFKQTKQKVQDAESLNITIHVDEMTGDRYSVNEDTGETAWLEEDGEGGAEDLDDEEEDICVDEDTGSRFSFNTTTGVSHWLDDDETPIDSEWRS